MLRRIICPAVAANQPLQWTSSACVESLYRALCGLPRTRLATERQHYPAGATLNETDYFCHLEMRVSRELAGMRQRELRAWWCGGFLPGKFVVTEKGCHVSGQVWIDSGRTQALWNFVVLLGPSLKSFDGVDWAALIPAEDVTGWLSLDFENKFLKIKTYAGVPDGSPTAG